ncbi:hypothetical protein [Pseudomonas agarici]|uniref:hypothetical protein n=1 Tax=Pseudomonas agarici TaxID=46677 RepID=UPI0015A35700|nr:hypothetical protein [Pseudomonas agarici]NWB92639.1 hypothetical protein [Pseudomonas agarici]
MSIGQLTKLNVSGLLTASTQALAKLPIPKSSRQINADSLKWLDKLGSSIGNRITASIQNGSLFELASLGANIFGMPAFSERGETHRPVLNFQPGQDQDLNLASVDMQSPDGKLQRWASAPGVGSPDSPPASPNRPQGNSTSPLLPPRPGAKATLTSMGVALGNAHHVKINGQVHGTPPPLPGRHSAVKPPPPPSTPPSMPSQQPVDKENLDEAPDMPLDDIEKFMVGPSFGALGGAPLQRRKALRRASEPAIPSLSPKLMEQAQRALSFPGGQPTKPVTPSIQPGNAEAGMEIPDSLRPGLGRRVQSNPVADNFSALQDIPDALRPGANRRRQSEPANAIEARSRIAAANALSAAQRPMAVQASSSAPVRFTNMQPMQQIYKGEEAGQVFGTKVKYLNAQERAAFKVTIKDGKVYDASGKLFDTRQASTAFAQNKGRAIFVMDAHGSMYISNEQTRGKFHHSSFFGGASVAAAGDVRIENGVMTAISRKSGHYRPSSAQLNQAVNHLKSQGVAGVFIDEDLS